MFFLNLYFFFSRFFLNLFLMIKLIQCYLRNRAVSYFNDSKLGKLIFIYSFSDSGILDFFLLSTFDLLFRYFFVYSLLLLSEFSVVEKASWRFFSYLVSYATKYTFFEINNIWEFFFMILMNIITLFSLFLFIYILFI